MADYVYASIEIGGEFTNKELKELFNACKDDGLDVEFDEFKALLKDASLEHYEARWGEFENMESVLRGLNKPFDRHTDSGPEWNSFVFYFRPGREDRIITELEPGYEQVDRDPVVEALEQLQNIKKNRTFNDVDDIKVFVKYTNRAIEILEFSLGDPIEPLPDFKLKENDE